MSANPPKRDAVRLDVKRLTDVDTSILKRELADGLRLTTDHLNYLAAIWGELERRGEDLSNLRIGVGTYLSKIATGKLLADVVVKYAGEPMTINRLAVHDISVQQSVINGGKLPWTPKPVKASRRPARHPKLDEDGELQKEGPAEYIAQAKVASIGDVADLIMQMVKESENPTALAEKLRIRLQRFLETGGRG